MWDKEITGRFLVWIWIGALLVADFGGRLLGRSHFDFLEMAGFFSFLILVYGIAAIINQLHDIRRTLAALKFGELRVTPPKSPQP